MNWKIALLIIITCLCFLLGGLLTIAGLRMVYMRTNQPREEYLYLPKQFGLAEVEAATELRINELIGFYASASGSNTLMESKLRGKGLDVVGIVAMIDPDPKGAECAVMVSSCEYPALYLVLPLVARGACRAFQIGQLVHVNGIITEVEQLPNGFFIVELDRFFLVPHG